MTSAATNLTDRSLPSQRAISDADVVIYDGHCRFLHQPSADGWPVGISRKEA